MCQRVYAGRLAPNSQLFTVCTATQFRAIMNEKTCELACAGVSNYEPTRYHGRCHVASYMRSLSSNASPTSVRRRPYAHLTIRKGQKPMHLHPVYATAVAVLCLHRHTSGTGINIDTTLVSYSDWWVVAMGNMRAIQREKLCPAAMCGRVGARETGETARRPGAKKLLVCRASTVVCK